jgi:hypothetical protein
VDADGEREPDELPPDELPPASEAPPDAAVPAEPPPPRHEEEDDEGSGEGRPRSGSGPAGTASESTNTSPRMCSTYWTGTPDWFTGWVNTTCTPVALTVRWAELVVPGPAPI